MYDYLCYKTNFYLHRARNPPTKTLIIKAWHRNSRQAKMPAGDNPHGKTDTTPLHAPAVIRDDRGVSKKRVADYTHGKGGAEAPPSSAIFSLVIESD